MKVVAAINLGLKDKDPLHPLESAKPIRSEGMIPVGDYTDKLMHKNDKASKALTPSQSQDFYKVKGTNVDKMA